MNKKIIMVEKPELDWIEKDKFLNHLSDDLKKECSTILKELGLKECLWR